ncbi:MAG TPA: GNAT family N-acetyltransferase [Solirubrobacterales bacterium]|jgi:GNAT superfamily N-acetyltransferase|nr:GNAT family N-acetyltransferase [Solirubrobacterales bacterium]
MTVELREARRGDELAVAEVHVRSWQEAYRGLMPDSYLDSLDPRDRASRYAFEASDPAAPKTVLAIGKEDGDEVVLGFATFCPSRDEDLPGFGEIVALYVDPDRHNGGVGRLLMAEARRRLSEAGFQNAFLWVLDGNTRAATFYEREGWLPDGSKRVERPYDIVSNVSRFRRRLP